MVQRVDHAERGFRAAHGTAFTCLRATKYYQCSIKASLMTFRFSPERTLILAVGHDEEVGGFLGARCIAALLEERGVQLEVIIDEGGVVASDGFSFVHQPVAFVATAEKVVCCLDCVFRTFPDALLTTCTNGPICCAYPQNTAPDVWCVVQCIVWAMTKAYSSSFSCEENG